MPSPQPGVSKVTWTRPSAKSRIRPHTSAGPPARPPPGRAQHQVPQPHPLDQLGRAVGHQHRRARREARLVVHGDARLTHRVGVQVRHPRVVHRLPRQAHRHHLHRRRPPVPQHQHVPRLQVPRLHPTPRPRIPRIPQLRRRRPAPPGPARRRPRTGGCPSHTPFAPPPSPPPRPPRTRGSAAPAPAWPATARSTGRTPTPAPPPARPRSACSAAQPARSAPPVPSN